MSIGEVVSKREAPHSYAIHIQCKRMLITYGDPNAIDLALVLSSATLFGTGSTKHKGDVATMCMSLEKRGCG